jgi:tRNA/rRNA methyltransferase
MAKHDLTLPAIVLVEPQLGENIGSAARVMANFGLTDLRLVAPRDGWPNAKAEPLSAGAFDGVVSVSVFETVGAAVAQCEAVYATTARPRDMIKPVLGADEAMSAIAARTGQCAILFGGEKSGLSNADVAAANAIITLPVNAGFSSLNLSMAVGVCAYAWGMTVLGQPEAVEPDEPMATHEELEGMQNHLIDALYRAGFFFPENKMELMALNIRAPFARANMTAQEVRTLRGCIKALEHGPRRHRPLE